MPAHLPVVEEVIVPEPVKACPDAWRCIGEEVTEQLDYEPAHFFRRRIVRRKYARKDHPFAAPILARLDTLQDRCIAAPGLIAAVIVGKYCDHLPLYRQEQIFATRHGVQIPRQTMAQWMALAADWLRPIYETIRTGVLGGGYVQVDEPSAARSPAAGSPQGERSEANADRVSGPRQRANQARLPVDLLTPRRRRRVHLAHQPRRRVP